MSTIMSTRGRDSESTRPKSLNRGLRKRELLRVTAENQAILRRLQDKHPSYSVHLWEVDRKRQEETLRLRCEYPYTSAPTSFRGHSRGSARHHASTPSPASRTLTASNPVSPIKARTKPNDRRVVLKRGVNIADQYFIVEIATDQR